QLAKHTWKISRLADGPVIAVLLQRYHKSPGRRQIQRRTDHAPIRAFVIPHAFDTKLDEADALCSKDPDAVELAPDDFATISVNGDLAQFAAGCEQMRE